MMQKVISRSIRSFYIALLFLLLFACKHNNDSILHDRWKEGKNICWIGDNKQLPQADSLFYKNHPSPIFRKEFSLKSDVQSAYVYLTAAGYYRASINGKRLGNDYLSPAWTNFSKRVYYRKFDITQKLKTKNNCLGVMLGNGFYNPLPLRMWGRRNLREVLPIGMPVFAGKIVIEYADGQIEEIVSSPSWKFSYGPVMKNNVYIGEVYDARKEIKEWDKPGFDDSNWQDAIVKEGPGGKLHEAFFPPVKIIKTIKPKEISTLPEGIYVADMGENFTGTFSIKVNGTKGDTIIFRFGERLYPDGSLNPMTTVCGQIKEKGRGGPGAPDVAWQTDTYVPGNNGQQIYQPEFTFHTYRYMEISGTRSKPATDDIQGLALSTDVAENNNFSCSSGLLNSIQENCKRTFRANIIGVQSDCASREKFGYGGDLNATSEAFIYNYDMQSFYRKTIYDWVDAMNDSVFIDTAPYVGIKYCGISWESAFLITQYYLLLYYNDVESVKELYALDKKWMDKVARLHPGGLVDSGLSDHESLEPVPVGLTGTCHYLFCATIMQKFASIMGDKENEEAYTQLAKKLKQIIKSNYWDKPVTEKINKQTLFASLLYFGIVPEEETKAAADSLINALSVAPSGHFTTGIFGTKYILDALSEYVSPEKVLEVVNSTEYPGWGYMSARGATTIWEAWKESDNIYSNCHPMFGSVSEWFYKWLGGIQPIDASPGFDRFIFKPTVSRGLDYINCSYLSPHGEIVSNWKRSGKSVIYSFTVPNGTTALVDLKKDKQENISISKKGDNNFMLPDKTWTTGDFELPGGEYEVVISKN